MRAKKIIRGLERHFFPERSRERFRRQWERRWSEEDSPRPWMDRGASKQILEAVETGWFPAGGLALDTGCGSGDFEILRSDEAELSDPGDDGRDQVLSGLVYSTRRR